MKAQLKKLSLVLSGVLAFSIPFQAMSHSYDVQPSGKIKFVDIAKMPESGIDFERVKSAREVIQDELRSRDSVPQFEIVFSALKPRGIPGVIIFDADNDNDEDIYVTNGPGAANSLYINQLNESGNVTFIDKGIHSGLAATNQDSTGICYGDIDNDGDDDILVQGSCEASLLYINQGDGTFVNTEFPNSQTCSQSCSMADIDNDGLLDIVSANLSTEMSWEVLALGPFHKTSHNQVYRNLGNNEFADISTASGIESTKGFLSPSGSLAEFDGSSTPTWAISTVDLDLDGDVDIIQADDQASNADASQGGANSGEVRIFKNDGDGNFTDETLSAGTNILGQWMGLAFGDANCDGNMDYFATNGGDYANDQPVQYASRWFFGNGVGGFTDSNDLNMWTPSAFGWGTSAFDYDNDGDTDIVYHGGMDAMFFVVDGNPGVIMNNDDCTGNMTIDTEAMSATDHSRRVINGVAVGDLDNNGFADIVSVANQLASADIPIFSNGTTLGSPLDDATGLIASYDILDSGEFRWNGNEYQNGNLSVEINDGATNNNWVKVNAIGTKDLTHNGEVNRSGIGAVVSVTPRGGKTSMRPIVGGASYASQDSLKTIFGLGKARHSTVDVLWPGGVRNRLYYVKANQELILPEIPCSYDAEWGSYREYRRCVKRSVKQLKQARVINKRQSRKITWSAIIAYFEHNYR